jgi:HEAT repeat protein
MHKIPAILVMAALLCAAMFRGEATEIGDPNLEADFLKAVAGLDDKNLEKRVSASESILLIVSGTGFFEKKEFEFSNRTVLKKLIEIIKNREADAQLRSNLLRVICESKELALDFDIDIGQILNDETENELVRSWSAMALSELGKSHAAQRALIQASASPNVNVRTNANQQLTRIGIDDEQLFLHAQKSMLDERPQIRVAAITIAAQLAGKGFKRELVLPILLSSVYDNEEYVRTTGTELLKVLNIDLDSIKSELIKATKSPDIRIRMHAASALISSKDKLAFKEFSPVLFEGIRDKNPENRELAIALLSNCAIFDDLAVTQSLTFATKDPDERVRIASSFGLSKYKVATKETLQIIIDGLHSNKEEIRDIAAYDLPLVSKHSVEMSKPMLLSMLDDHEPFIRSIAIISLAQCSLPAFEAHDLVSRSMKDKDPQVRIAVLTVLPLLISDSFSAAEFINLARKDSDQRVKNTALQLDLELRKNIKTNGSGK